MLAFRNFNKINYNKKNTIFSRFSLNFLLIFPAFSPISLTIFPKLPSFFVISSFFNEMWSEFYLGKIVGILVSLSHVFEHFPFQLRSARSTSYVESLWAFGNVFSSVKWLFMVASFMAETLNFRHKFNVN